MTSAIVRVGLPLILPVVLLVVWAVLTSDGESFYFPPLAEILPRIGTLWFDEKLTSDFLPSLGRVLVSWMLASVIGVIGGLIVGGSRVIRDLTTPLVNFLRAIPSAALVPFAILAFGIGDAGKIFVIVFVCIWPVFINTADGVEEIDPGQLETVRAFRISAIRRLGVVLTAASPRIAVGMRTSLAFAVIVMMISEMVASTNGIGFVTIQAQRTFQTVDMWAGILMLGLLGFALNLIFELIERRTLKWNFDSKRVGE